MFIGLVFFNLVVMCIDWYQCCYVLVQGEELQIYFIFCIIVNVEWDILLFFYGVFVCVGGLVVLGYLELVLYQFYGNFGYILVNVIMGVILVVVDNILIMFVVFKMNLLMDEVQWLLIIFIVGVGGSLFLVGLVVGVVLMGVLCG